MAAVNPTDLVWELGEVEGLIGSPPCQTFSLAGKKEALDSVRGQLVWEPIRYAQALAPEWIALEEVPTVLPLWRVYEEVLRTMGYRTWSGVLDASAYGVPQRRKRAILMASRGPLRPPTPTHGPADHDDLFGAPRAPYVTMAEALGWGITDAPARTVMAGSSRTGGPRPLDGGAGARAHYWEAVKRGAWQPNPDDPGDHAWVFTRPATTVVGSFRPDILAAPGWRKDPKVPRQNAPGSVPITVEQAGVLQSFRIDYPWQGAKTRRYEQVGNAIPPLLAAAILKELI